MSPKKSRPNQASEQSDTTPSKRSSSNSGQLVPNRPKSTGLLRGDDNETIDEIDEVDEVDEAIDDATEVDQAVQAPAKPPTGKANKNQTATPDAAVDDPSTAEHSQKPTSSRPPRRTTSKTTSQTTSARRTGLPASATAVVASGVAKTYGDLPALAPLDLTVATGERVALIGHNGSGKTTFLKIVCGLLEPSDGSVTVFGNEPGSMPARRAVSYLSDQPVFYEDLSLIEHIEYVARLHGVDDWVDSGEDLLERFRLGERRDDLPVTFSRGLKQKASICLAFIRPFDLLVVDEPFVGLDALGRTELLALMTEHHRQGATLLVATHELTTVGESDRIVALRSGEIAYDGDTDVDVAALVDDAT